MTPSPEFIELAAARARIAELEAALTEIKLKSRDWYDAAVQSEAYFVARGFRELYDMARAAPSTADASYLCDMPGCRNFALPADLFCTTHRAEVDAQPITDPNDQYADMDGTVTP